MRAGRAGAAEPARARVDPAGRTTLVRLSPYEAVLLESLLGVEGRNSKNHQDLRAPALDLARAIYHTQQRPWRIVLEIGGAA